MGILNIYSDKKVFLTGHTGFKGSWLLTWLHELGANIKGYSLAPENEQDLYNLIDGNSFCKSVIADIRDKQRLQDELTVFQPDFIFHLAAQPLVRPSYQIPTETFEINTLGTAYLLDAVRSLEKPCVVIIITTDKVYENQEWNYAYREIDRLGGYDPYSASKAAAEIVVSSYRKSFFNPDSYNVHQKALASARAGNVIGGGDWAKDRIIPDIVRALQATTSIRVRNPNAVRPWQHVLEPISGYLLLGAKLAIEPIKYATAWNFGPYMADTLTVGEVVNKVIKIWGEGEAEIKQNANAPHEAGLLMLDISKSINELGWKPKWNAKIAIENTIKAYQSYTYQTIIEQINTYQIKDK
ncbi:CDP-glucose 4,6-dehydratase [Arcicella rigui]|uniref:CDP-glucose 4,6-dehydratase n=1 Tax=Arcicella rigui TaxID=797020 RepID=A0ABU5QE93_9BACT|nr:CDP-glucose 4,6-dehydratase [Arcicella rigui]MEA5141156.1 CDP-glucose 4,6-dehydratase [Arcicella rigui]